jgi:Tfp pilus assembly protein PilZ
MNTFNTLEENIDKRSEFRFPIVIPVEYFNNGDLGIVTYAVDISKNGTFISSDEPLEIGHHVGMNLSIPVNNFTSELLKTEGEVMWQRVQPFKSPKNGMGIRFSEPLPEGSLLNTLSSSVTRLVKEKEAKKELEEQIKRLEFELEDLKGLADLGRYTEKLLQSISNPLTSMYGRFELIRNRLGNYLKVIEEKCMGNNNGFRNVKKDCEMCLKDIDCMLDNYKEISELIRITGDNRKDLEVELKDL